MDKPERPNKHLPRAEGTSRNDCPFISFLASLLANPSLPIPSTTTTANAVCCLIEWFSVEGMTEDGGLRGLEMRERTDETLLGQEMVVEGKKGAADFALWTRLL
jgi:hypothetical protein